MAVLVVAFVHGLLGFAIEALDRPALGFVDFFREQRAAGQQRGQRDRQEAVLDMRRMADGMRAAVVESRMHHETSITPEPPKAIMPPTERIDCQIPAACAGMRLDQALAELLPTYSRSRLQQWLKAGQLRVDGVARRPRDPVAGGETVSGELELERNHCGAPGYSAWRYLRRRRSAGD
jgi:hypothetical protein